jgi:hypothetical protein
MVANAKATRPENWRKLVDHAACEFLIDLILERIDKKL